MNITLKPAMKRALPLAIAALSLAPLAANTKKSEPTVNNTTNIEYLQASTYEEKGDARIKAGLTKDKAYKNEAIRDKFDRANLE